jgi:CRISPR/Cas system-associated endonuclease Cas3-HD
MNKQTLDMPINDRRLLAYTMLFHDIGKPAKHIVREKNGEMIDSFFNHNVESEKVAKRVLANFGFNKEEIAIICKLVYKHDIFMFITADKTTNPYHKELSDELLDKEIEDLNQVADGQMLMQWLVMIGRSDNLAQNEKMTGKALELLEKFDEMLEERQNKFIKKTHF